MRRIVSIWFPRLASDRILRARPASGPVVVGVQDRGAWRVLCLNRQAQARGLGRGMALSEARVLCPGLRVAEADPARDAQMLEVLRRWAMRYCPWVGLDQETGLVLDVTGSTHLWGGEEAMLADIAGRLSRAGFEAGLGLADTRGAAWALAHYAQDGAAIAPAGGALAALAELPVAGLRLEEAVVIGLQRLGLRHIGALAAAPRAPLARRFGAGLLDRLDQALGNVPEPVSVPVPAPRYSASLSLPEPIGLSWDVMAGIGRLMGVVCAKLLRHAAGARALRLTLRRVDRESCQISLRLAVAMNDPARILPLFARDVEQVDAGFGIDHLRLEAVLVEPLPLQQITVAQDQRKRGLEDLITRIGARIGLENILRYQPVDSHLPERSFVLVPATELPGKAIGEGADHNDRWLPPDGRPRPMRLFPPEPVTPRDEARPPGRFRWRGMEMATAHATGPERIAPPWWDEDKAWARGLRDYWHVQTKQGWRLWLFHTPQEPGWFVHGEFL